jgi:hypothetical protein
MDRIRHKWFLSVVFIYVIVQLAGRRWLVVEISINAMEHGVLTAVFVFLGRLVIELARGFRAFWNLNGFGGFPNPQ